LPRMEAKEAARHIHVPICLTGQKVRTSSAQSLWPVHLLEIGLELNPVLCPISWKVLCFVGWQSCSPRGLGGGGGSWEPGRLEEAGTLTSRVRVGLSRMTSRSTTTSASSVTLHTAVVRIMLSAFRYLSYWAYVIFTGCCTSGRRNGNRRSEDGL
jgi:hypothetical protein